VILFIVLAQCNGGIPGMGSTSDSGSDEVADCETGADAAKSENCKLTLFVSAIERYWEEALPKQAGVEYSNAQLQIFSGSTSSGCGQASSAMGPFYCPADKYVYIDSTFFDDMLKKDLGAEGGDFAEAYVVAHELGHHVQSLLGIDSRMRQLQSRNPSETNELSVRLELQADCFAGVWAHATNKAGRSAQGRVELEAGDLEEGLRAAAAIGDDRIQRMSTGHVFPDKFTHGTSDQRVTWLRRGFENGTPDACQTFQ